MVGVVSSFRKVGFNVKKKRGGVSMLGNGMWVGDRVYLKLVGGELLFYLGLDT